ncbi:SCO family protein [Leptospira sarikeiensis]|uniref:Uncharacterized protein n=1 Tax=Leptospira sarikeiensis TaxID=2484943 RepID=A0A4R9K1W2_9LEPT|nr:SCO family protein [Leptospira sarikeiensis]TGL58814.1 hypothetical protein EHQ64_17355 [Leptospira sarikeiensis]
METGRWKIVLTAMAALIPILFFISHSDPGMIPAEKELPEESILLVGKAEKTSLRSIFSGKQTFLYFGFLNSSKKDQEELKNFLTWFHSSSLSHSQFVFISLDPEKDNLQDLKDKFGKLSEKILLLKPESSSSALELARSFGIQAYILPESGLEYKAALIWVDDSPKIRGIFPKFPEKPDSISIPSLLVETR